MINLLTDSVSEILYETLISIKPAVLRSVERATQAISRVAFEIYEEMNRGDEVPEEVLRLVQARPISPILGNELGEYAISHPLWGEREVVLEGLDVEQRLVTLCFIDQKTKIPEETQRVSRALFLTWNPRQIW